MSTVSYQGNTYTQKGYNEATGKSRKVGAFYWVRPALDPDSDEQWENEDQPARFCGYDERETELWCYLSTGEPTDWPAIWVGDEIIKTEPKR